MDGLGLPVEYSVMWLVCCIHTDILMCTILVTVDFLRAIKVDRLWGLGSELHTLQPGFIYSNIFV